MSNIVHAENWSYSDMRSGVAAHESDAAAGEGARPSVDDTQDAHTVR
jgi:hypothetical protein